MQPKRPVGDQGKVPEPWLQPGAALTINNIWGMNQWLFCSLPQFLPCYLPKLEIGKLTVMKSYHLEEVIDFQKQCNIL